MSDKDTATAVPAPPTPHPTPHRTAGLLQLVLLLAGSCAAVLASTLISPVLPQMAAEFASTPGVDVLVPVVLTVPALMVALFAPFAGLVVDAIDRKRLLVVAMFCYGLLGTMPLYLDTLTGILLSRVGVGVCEAAIMTCCTTLIGDHWSGARRTRYLGMQVLVAAVAATALFGIGGALGATGWRTPFWLYAFALPIGLVMAVALWQPERPAAEPRASRRLEPVPWAALAGPCALTVLGGVWFFVLIVELPFVLVGQGVREPAVIGAVAAAMSVATALGAVAVGRLTARGPRTLLPAELGLTAVGLLVVASSSAPPMTVVGAVLTGLGTGMILPTLLTWTMNRLSFSQRGRGTGIWTASLFLGQFACPLLVAAVAALAGGLQVAIGVLGVVAAVMVVVTLVGLRGTDEPLNAESRIAG